MNRQRNKGGRFLSKNELDKKNGSPLKENTNLKENYEDYNNLDNNQKSNQKKFKEEKKDETFTDHDYYSVVNLNQNENIIFNKK